MCDVVRSVVAFAGRFMCRHPRYRIRALLTRLTRSGLVDRIRKSAQQVDVSHRRTPLFIARWYASVPTTTPASRRRRSRTRQANRRHNSAHIVVIRPRDAMPTDRAVSLDVPLRQVPTTAVLVDRRANTTRVSHHFVHVVHSFVSSPKMFVGGRTP